MGEELLVSLKQKVLPVLSSPFQFYPCNVEVAHTNCPPVFKARTNKLHNVTLSNLQSSINLLGTSAQTNPGFMASVAFRTNQQKSELVTNRRKSTQGKSKALQEQGRVFMEE